MQLPSQFRGMQALVHGQSISGWAAELRLLKAGMAACGHVRTTKRRLEGPLKLGKGMASG